MVEKTWALFTYNKCFFPTRPKTFLILSTYFNHTNTNLSTLFQHWICIEKSQLFLCVTSLCSWVAILPYETQKKDLLTSEGWRICSIIYIYEISKFLMGKHKLNSPTGPHNSMLCLTILVKDDIQRLVVMLISLFF